MITHVIQLISGRERFKTDSNLCPLKTLLSLPEEDGVIPVEFEGRGFESHMNIYWWLPCVRSYAVSCCCDFQSLVHSSS